METTTVAGGSPPAGGACTCAPGTAFALGRPRKKIVAAAPMAIPKSRSSMYLIGFLGPGYCTGDGVGDGLAVGVAVFMNALICARTCSGGTLLSPAGT